MLIALWVVGAMLYLVIGGFWSSLTNRLLTPWSLFVGLIWPVVVVMAFGWWLEKRTS